MRCSGSRASQGIVLGGAARASGAEATAGFVAGMGCAVSVVTSELRAYLMPARIVYPHPATDPPITSTAKAPKQNFRLRYFIRSFGWSCATVLSLQKPFQKALQGNQEELVVCMGSVGRGDMGGGGYGSDYKCSPSFSENSCRVAGIKARTLMCEIQEAKRRTKLHELRYEARKAVLRPKGQGT